MRKDSTVEKSQRSLQRLFSLRAINHQHTPTPHQPCPLPTQRNNIIDTSTTIDATFSYLPSSHSLSLLHPGLVRAAHLRHAYISNKI
eukprot:scaffold1783_cov119-Skeletonema_dohrnii-CCMP3373.AAC.3